VKIGVLSLQGAFRLHAEVLDALDVEPVDVRTPEALAGIDAIIVPGGESTTMSMLLDSSGVREPLRDALREGLPAFGTCAGMIMLGAATLDGRPDQVPLGAIDIDVRRNAFGRQKDSFEAMLDVEGLDEPLLAVFIRAPFVERVGAGVEVLASVDGHPVLCRSGSVTVCSFHPELSHDLRLHRQFLEGLS
jgi:pyridoxal 5'-phosphate synthase pdxT subunit